MAKLKNIRYLLKVELNKMQAYGCKKHEDKKKTKKERSIAKSEGKTLRERDEINHSRDKIYSYTTMKTYQQQIGYFATFLNDRGLGKITIDQAREHIQEYMVFLIEKKNRQARYIQPWQHVQRRVMPLCVIIIFLNAV